MSKLNPETRRLIIKALRETTLRWAGRNAAFKRHRKLVWEGDYYKTGPRKGQKKYKFHYQCVKCKTWYRDLSFLEADHKIPIGSWEFEHSENWTTYIEAMFCDDNPENVQPLCIPCHRKKSSNGNAKQKYKRKSDVDYDPYSGL